MGTRQRRRSPLARRHQLKVSAQGQTQVNREMMTVYSDSLRLGRIQAVRCGRHQHCDAV